MNSYTIGLLAAVAGTPSHFAANAYSASYTPDGEGNRTSQTIGTATTAFTLDNDDELTAASSTTGGLNNSYSYNANGEQTGRTLAGTAYTLAFDYDGQMTSLTQGSAVTSYVYDLRHEVAQMIVPRLMAA